MQICVQPPLLIRHSFTLHDSCFSSSNPGQSMFLSHTLSMGMHMPPVSSVPQSNCVYGSQLCTGSSENDKGQLKWCVLGNCYDQPAGGCKQRTRYDEPSNRPNRYFPHGVSIIVKDISRFRLVFLSRALREFWVRYSIIQPLWLIKIIELIIWWVIYFNFIKNYFQNYFER